MFFKKRIYLDHAAGVSANPSSPHAEGREARRILEDARRAIARLTEVQADDVIFTGGATEANALAILGHAQALKHRGKTDIRFLYLSSAHASVVENMKALSQWGITIAPLPIREARVDTEALAQMLEEHTAFVSMDAVCGETGIIWNTREVKEVIRRSGKEILLHVDASQAPLTQKLARSHFEADLMTLDASKVGSVRGVGALIAHQTIPLAPLYCGGGQERGLRPGSEFPELAARFAEKLKDAVALRENFRSAAFDMRQELVSELAKDARLADVVVNEGRAQAPHILNLSLPGRDTDYLVALLDEAGFAVSTRSACETDREEGSRAVFTLTRDMVRAKSTLRISWGHDIRPPQLRLFLKALGEAVSFVDSHSLR